MNITTEQLKARLANLVATDAQEIGGRVADVRPLIEEIIALRAQEQEHKSEVERLTASLEEATNFACCAYCQTKLPKDPTTIVEHMSQCEKGPWKQATELVAMGEQITSENERLHAERDALARQVEGLQKSLIRHGDHENECALRIGNSIHCDCGWSKMRESLEAITSAMKGETHE